MYVSDADYCAIMNALDVVLIETKEIKSGRLLAEKLTEEAVKNG